MAATIVGVFNDFTAALKTIPELIDVGVDRNDISTVAQDSKGEYARFLQADALPGDATSNVGVGAAIGGVSGFLIGLAALAIPGIGPVIAAGPLAAAFGGATVGAATGGLFGALNGLGLPEFEAQAYDQGVREGGTLLIVKTSDDRVSAVLDVLRRRYAVRIDQHPELKVQAPGRSFSEPR